MAEKENMDFEASQKLIKSIAQYVKMMEKGFKGAGDKAKDLEVTIKVIEKLAASIPKLLIMDKGKSSKLNKLQEELVKSAKVYTDTLNKNEEWTRRRNQLYEKESKLYEIKNSMMEQRVRLHSGLKQQEEQQRADNVLAHSREISSRNLKQEEMKTGRARLSLMKKLMGTMEGGGGMLGGLEGGIGALLAGGTMGSMSLAGGAAERVGEKVGVSGRILKYQHAMNRGGVGEGGSAFTRADASPMGFATQTGKAGDIGASLRKMSPRLHKMLVGGTGLGGKLDTGGVLGKAGRAAGKLGGLAPMLAGGAAGMVSGIVMKGLESSPMFKAMSKVIGQAFSLYLRPIGDLVGGIFKPLMIPMMKMAAMNAKKGSALIKDGERIGKGLVAFVSNPAGFLGSVFEQMGEHLKAVMWGGEAEDVLGKYVEDTYTSWVDAIDKEFGSMRNDVDKTTAVISGLGDTVKTGQAKTNEILDKMYGQKQKEVADYMKNTIAPNMTSEQEAGYKKFAGTNWAKSDVGQATGLFDEEGELLKEDLAIVGEVIIEGSESLEETLDKQNKYQEAAAKKQNALIDSSTHYAEASSVMFQQAAEEIKRRLSALIKAQIKARTKTDSEGKTTVGKADSAVIKTLDLMKQSAKYSEYEGTWWAKSEYGQKTGLFDKGGNLTGQGLNQGKGIRAAMASAQATGNKSGIQKAADLMAMASGMWNWDENRPKTASEVLGYAHGGIINEPIFGVGASGQKYMFGENGSEIVTPANKSTGTSVNVVINIAKMSKDIDLLQIKPIVERAILETHSRRGII